MKKFASQSKLFVLLSDTGILGIGSFLAKAIQYFLLPFYTSVMQTDAYGTAELLNNLNEILLPVMTLAVYEAVFRFAVDQTGEREAVLGEALKLTLRAFLGAALLAALAWWAFAFRYAWSMLCALLTYALRTVLMNYVRGCGKSKCYALSGLLCALSLVLFSWLFLARYKAGVNGYLFAVAAANLVAVIVLLIGGKVRFSVLTHARNKDLLHSMLVYCAPLIVNNIAWWCTGMFGRYAILFSLGANVAGIYTAANKLPSIINTASQVFQQAWQLHASREYGKDGDMMFFRSVFNAYNGAVLLLGSGAVCCSRLLAALTLKNDFYQARFYIPAMMLSAIIGCLSAYFGSLLIAFKQTRSMMNGMLLGAVINIALSLMLVNRFGVWGVLAAANIGNLTVLILRITDVKKRLGVRFAGKAHIAIFAIVCAQTVLMSFAGRETIWLSAALFAAVLCIEIRAYYRKKGKGSA